MSYICTGVESLTIRLLRFFVRFNFTKRKKKIRICYYKLSQSSYHFESLKSGVKFKKQNNLQRQAFSSNKVHNC